MKLRVEVVDAFGERHRIATARLRGIPAFVTTEAGDRLFLPDHVVGGLLKDLRDARQQPVEAPYSDGFDWNDAFLLRVTLSEGSVETLEASSPVHAEAAPRLCAVLSALGRALAAIGSAEADRLREELLSLFHPAAETGEPSGRLGVRGG